MKNISVSLEDELIKILEKILLTDKTKRSRSAIVSESLREYIISHYPHLLQRTKENLGPSILYQLKTNKKIIKGPSFRFTRKLKINMEPWKLIE